jgi:hypothetical protein
LGPGAQVRRRWGTRRGDGAEGVAEPTCRAVLHNNHKHVRLDAECCAATRFSPAHTYTHIHTHVHTHWHKVSLLTHATLPKRITPSPQIPKGGLPAALHRRGAPPRGRGPPGGEAQPRGKVQVPAAPPSPCRRRLLRPASNGVRRMHRAAAPRVQGTGSAPARLINTRMRSWRRQVAGIRLRQLIAVFMFTLLPPPSATSAACPGTPSGLICCTSTGAPTPWGP